MDHWLGWPDRAWSGSPDAGPESRNARTYRSKAHQTARRIGASAHPMRGGRVAARQAGSLSTSSWTAADGRVERDPLVGRQLDLEDALHAAPPEDHGHADEQARRAELALEEDGARQHALPVAQDRVDHLERGRGRGVERGAGLQQRDDLGAAVGGPLLERRRPGRPTGAR